MGRPGRTAVRVLRNYLDRTRYGFVVLDRFIAAACSLILPLSRSAVSVYWLPKKRGSRVQLLVVLLILLVFFVFGDPDSDANSHADPDSNATAEQQFEPEQFQLVEQLELQQFEFIKQLKLQQLQFEQLKL